MKKNCRIFHLLKECDNAKNSILANYNVNLIFLRLYLIKFPHCLRLYFI